MIRRYILILFSAVACFCTSAQETPDTLLRATDVNVVITESPEGLCVDASNDAYSVSHTEPYPANATIRSTQNRFRMPSADLWQSRNIDWDLRCGVPMFGFTSAQGAPSALDIEMGKSFEISWLNILAVTGTIRSIHSTVSAGIGITWRNYRTTTGMRFTGPDENGAIGFEPFAEDVTPKFARLKVFSLSFPVLFTRSFKIPRLSRVTLQLGPVLNWNSHASIRNKWVDDMGRSQTQSIKHVGQRRFSVDLYGAISLFDGVGFYVRYSPQSVLRHSPDLDFTPLSTGFILGL